MRCDVVAIGTELLLGQIVDTNSAWLGEQLSAAGIASCLQVKVGDNLERMVKAIRTTLADADAVLDRSKNLRRQSFIDTSSCSAEGCR